MTYRLAPASRAFAITPHDSNDLAETTRAIWTGAGGTIVCILTDDGETSTTFSNVASGCILPIAVKRVLATGTTATGLVGLA